MDHPLAGASTAGSEPSSLERNVRREERTIPAQFDDHALFGGNWADAPVGPSRSSHTGTIPRTNTVQEASYDSRLQDMLNDDHDIGQDRDEGFGSFQGAQELVKIRPSSGNEDSDYFGNSDGFATPGRDDFGDCQGGTSTPVKQSTSLNHTLLPVMSNATMSPMTQGSPARSSYRRPSYLHPSISRLRAHDRKASTSSSGSHPNPFGLSPSKPGHHRTASSVSRVSAISRKSSILGPLAFQDLSEEVVPNADSEKQSSIYGGAEGSVASGLPIQAEEHREQTAFAFQTLRTATDVLWSSSRADEMPPIRHSAASQMSDAPERKKRFNIGSAMGRKPIEESPLARIKDKSKGIPTVIDVNGIIAVGTDAGWVVVLDFNQEVRCVCGMEAIGQESGPITALRISPDATFVAAGHLNGNVYLYDLSSPSRPARSALALPLAALKTGRKEGHLTGTKIVDIDFVGKRHTAVVTSDETGRAFWWSLGKVMGVESNDVVRLLGGVPDVPATGNSLNGSGASTPERAVHGGHNNSVSVAKIKGPTLFAGRVLPLGENEQPSATYLLTAFLTPSKLVIVGLKPTPRIWYRRSRGLEGGEQARRVGCAAWLPAGARTLEPVPDTDNDEAIALPSDPVVAFSWGNSLRLVTVRTNTKAENTDHTLSFDETLHWKEDQPILALEWLNSEHLVLVTLTHLSLFHVRLGKRVEYSQYSMLSRLSWSRISPRSLSLTSRFSAHKGKIFILAESDLRAGSLLLWADRILSLCHAGDFLEAIHLTISYYSGTAPGNSIGLSPDVETRKSILRARALALMRSSLTYAFSQDRLTDGTYDSPDGRGVDLTPLFGGLADTCLNSCIIIGETGFAFEEVYEAYCQAGIQGIYLAKLENILLETRMKDIPPNLIQALIQMHDDRGEYKKAENVIWHVEPMSLDINQTITLCERHSLWDAYIYVYNQCMLDFVTPIAKFISLMDQAPAVGDDANVEHLPQAYTLFQYLESILVGCEYPDGRPFPDQQATRARRDAYECLLARNNMLRKKSQIDIELEQGDYPVLRTVLHYDTEALLHVLDIAFEDGYLNDIDTYSPASRQAAVDALIKVMDPADFPTGDITFMHIFVARNLPKYPQFIRLPASTTHQILISLARDPDMTTREDRQLAAEHLLSVYQPPLVEERRAEFRQAHFHRVLRQDYAKTKEWPEVLQSIVDDMDLDSDEIFAAIREILKLSTSKTTLAAVEKHIAQMLTVNIPMTAVLLEDCMPSMHRQVIDILRGTPIKQMAYLGALLQPELLEADASGSFRLPQRVASNSLDQASIQDYIRLLCDLARDRVLPFMEKQRSLIDLGPAVETCESQQAVVEAVWAMDASGDPARAVQRINEQLDNESQALHKAIQGSEKTEDESLRLQSQLDGLRELVNAGVQVCTKAESESSDKDFTESLWFDLLAKLVHVAQAFLQTEGSNAVDNANAKVEEEGAGAVLVVASMRQRIQDTLAALISSSTSSTLSFPRLFKRLVQASGSDPDTEPSTVYSEFRLILVSMLNTYHSEEDMLVLVTKLIQGDVFHWLKQSVDDRKAGWRVTKMSCHFCDQRFTTADPKKLDALPPDDPVCIPRTGSPYHWSCSRKKATAAVK